MKVNRWVYIVIGLVVLAAIGSLFQEREPDSNNSSSKTVESGTSGEMSFPKGYISLTAVKKHPKLQGESEYTAYWYRYNQSAAGYYYRKPEKAAEYLEKFRSYRSTLGEDRLDEIMQIADGDYPF